jgi:putative flippase GtrA
VLKNKFLKYFVTGGISAVIDVCVFAMLTGHRGSLVMASITSFIVAAIANYLMTSKFVFHKSLTFSNFGVFLVAATVGLAVNLGVTLVGAVFIGLTPTFSKICGIAIAFLVNFQLNARVTFRRKSES